MCNTLEFEARLRTQAVEIGIVAFTESFRPGSDLTEQFSELGHDHIIILFNTDEEILLIHDQLHLVGGQLDFGSGELFGLKCIPQGIDVCLLLDEFLSETIHFLINTILSALSPVIKLVSMIRATTTIAIKTLWLRKLVLG